MTFWLNSGDDNKSRLKAVADVTNDRESKAAKHSSIIFSRFGIDQKDAVQLLDVVAKASLEPSNKPKKPTLKK